MAGGVTSAATSVHLNDGASIGMSAFPECDAGPFVSVRLGEVASLLVHDLAVLDALSARVVEARNALEEMLAGQDPLPVADAVAEAGRVTERPVPA